MSYALEIVDTVLKPSRFQFSLEFEIERGLGMGQGMCRGKGKHIPEVCPPSPAEGESCKERIRELDLTLAVEWGGSEMLI